MLKAARSHAVALSRETFKRLTTQDVVSVVTVTDAVPPTEVLLPDPSLA